MLPSEQDIETQNKRMEEELLRLCEELAENENDIKYKLGLAVKENLNPRSKILSIPGELWKLRHVKSESELICRDYPDDLLEKRTYLQEQIKQLSFYNHKTRADFVFAVGEDIYNAGRSFLKLLCLPFRLWKTRKEHRMDSEGGTVRRHALLPIEGISKSVLFIATNGAGLGHLTRCLAVARRLKKESPETEIIFLTTSLALNTVHREGFTAYCIPAKMLIKNITATQWNALLKNMMEELLELYHFSAIIFDGAMPYASITAAMAKSDIPKIWIRRGSEKSSELVKQRVEAEKYFDYLIIPGEAKSQNADSDNKHYHVSPIIYLDKSEIWSRDDVRKYLKIPENKVVVYVQLGAGKINDIDSDINRVITELRKHQDIVVVLGESIIGNELKIIEDDIIILKDYPNSKYLNGFDFAISACGYNSFHELIYFGLPTIFLPNMNTKTDDQYARAMLSEEYNAGIVVTDMRSNELSLAISRMCDQRQNQLMRENCQKIIEDNGADSAASLIVNFMDISE